MTGVVYSPLFTHHVTPLGHPESPKRVQAIAESLKTEKLIWLEPKRATEDELQLCHTADYIALVKREVKELSGTQNLKMLSTGDVTISPESFDIACLAAGACITAVDAVFTGKVHNCFVVARPPGHHASASRGMGFCIFNNVACAARYAQSRFGIKRVAIIDWDLHHGNGTEDIFKEDASIFYFSTHQAGIYPGTGWESNEHICNCPIMPQGDTRKAIFDAFETELQPRLEQFKPECIFISCGFDAHEKDPLGQLALTDTDFYELTKLVRGYAKQWANEKLISVLEGGYNLEALKKCALAHVRGLVQ